MDKFKRCIKQRCSILTWILIRIRILGSTFWNSASGSSDPAFRNSGSGTEYLFQKKFMSAKWQYLFLLPPKFRKGISQIAKVFNFTLTLFTLHSFGLFLCYPDPIRERKLKWIRIRNAGIKSRITWVDFNLSILALCWTMIKQCLCFFYLALGLLWGQW